MKSKNSAIAKCLREGNYTPAQRTKMVETLLTAMHEETKTW